MDKRNESEGKYMHIADIIKYEGDNRTFVWKHPCEDFNTRSQLIVHESQEAVFYANGQILDIFTAGKYTLTTGNIPIICRIMSLPTGGVTPFHCEVYFINKAVQMAVRWGTSSKVEYIDPEYKFPLKIGASGVMNLTAGDAKTLLVKLVGTENVLSQDKLVSYFRDILSMRVKSCIAQEMREKKINIFQVDELLEEISGDLQYRLEPVFKEYGIQLVNFTLEHVVKPDGDPNYERYRRIFFEQSIGIQEELLEQKRDLIRKETSARKIVMEAEAMASKRKLEGYTYQEERSFDVAEQLSRNEGVGNFSSTGIGLGMIAGVGNTMGNAMAGIASEALQFTSGFAGESPKPDPVLSDESSGMAAGQSRSSSVGEQKEEPDEEAASDLNEGSEEADGSGEPFDDNQPEDAGNRQEAPVSRESTVENQPESTGNRQDQEEAAGGSGPESEGAPGTGNEPSKDRSRSLADFKERIEKLTMLKEAGLLSDEELSGMKSELVKEIMGDR